MNRRELLKTAVITPIAGLLSKSEAKSVIMMESTPDGPLKLNKTQRIIMVKSRQQGFAGILTKAQREFFDKCMDSSVVMKFHLLAQ